MSSYEEQLKTVWQVVKIISKKEEVCGGALCYREDGHLLTAYHVVETPNNIQVRKQDDAGFREAIFVNGIRSLDVARIVPKFDGEKFEFRAPHDDIELQVNDLLVTHGHGAGIPFSSRFGNVAYPYQPSMHTDLAATLHNLELTLDNSDEAHLERMRDECPPPQPFRTVGNVVAMREDQSFGELGHLHPFLPVIEQDEIGMKGFSGCPGFKDVNGELVGMAIGGTNGYMFFVPNDVLNFALQSLGMQ